jgi:preprotein translocase subunit SecD
MSSAGGTITVRMPDAQSDFVRDNAVQQALYTIRNRVDAFGVGEVNIQRLGGTQRNRILVELPGVEDPTRVKGLIQTQARLELRSAYYRQDGAGPFVAATRDDVVAALGGALPAGVEVLPVLERQESRAPLGQAPPKPQDAATQRVTSYMAVERASVITGSDLADARRSQGQWGDSVVSFQLQVSAAERFAAFTRANIGRQMPIVLDDKIISAPSIRSEIGMNGQIEGNFTAESSNDLAVQLRAGALPARVLTIEERTVGPSLGRDSIRSGVRAALVGAAMVCTFMLIYYKASGIIAIIALVLNMLILAGGMASVGAVLTLPGIAGYALTVGMAVDASVLIFERIREELRAGRAVRDAIKKGYEKAFSAIFDSNLCTIISAAFLLQYGTGPVRGFAVSLMIGLCANLFTGVFVSRFIYESVIGDRPVKSLSI